MRTPEFEAEFGEEMDNVEFEAAIIKAANDLLEYGFSKAEVIAKLAIPEQNILEATERRLKYQAALAHWLGVGYSFSTARGLASVLHGRDDAARSWGTHILLTLTNLKMEDMI